MVRNSREVKNSHSQRMMWMIKRKTMMMMKMESNRH